MLVLFTKMNKTITEVNVCSETPPYKLVDPGLLRQLMKRTGTGHRTNVRRLADASELSIGTISNLLTGIRESVPCTAAHAIADEIGVDVLILFTPTGRCVPAPTEPDTDTAEPSEAVTA